MSITVKVESVETKKVKKGRTDEEVTYKVTAKGSDGSKVVITTPEAPYVDASKIGSTITL